MFNHINYLKRDNIPVINLGQWPLEASLFEGDSTAGPVPTLFSEDPEAARSALEANVAKAHQDYQRAAKCFLMPETVNLVDAMAVIKKPRYYDKLK
jgi:hypothetical protein